MGIIRLLDDNTINKIAAGEVVNRPASVVKELLENSIDAQAKNIKIELQDGGKSLIKISDDGTGMDLEDAKMSLVRHATSKISNAEDLLFLDSMGFRGEAIPSIASVSRLTIQTNIDDKEKGVEITTESGKILSETKLHLPKGSTIVVKDLFYNIPARLKYLKGDTTEFSHILKVIQGLSVVYPNISFLLFHNNKKIFSTTGNNQVEEVLSDIYSYKVFQDMLKITHSDLGIKITGYISTPKQSRSGKDKQLFVVNKRLVNNSTLHAATTIATKFIFAGNQFPYLYLNIETDPSEIDVNVHPSKTEIKLYKEKFIFDSILQAVKNSFRNTKNQEENIQENISYEIKGQVAQSPKKSYQNQEKIHHKPDELFNEKLNNSNSIYEKIINNQVYKSETEIKQPKVETINNVYEVFQFKQTYLVFFYQAKLRIIDQHAAHERIMFEKIKNNKIAKGSQELLFPENIFLDQQDFLVFEEINPILHDFGYIIDTFGKDSIIIRSVPTDLPDNTNHKEVVMEIIADSKKDTSDRITKILTTVACKAAIKAGDTLENKEKISLVNDWINCPNNCSCPHGRPIEKSFDEKEIDKWFHRG